MKQEQSSVNFYRPQFFDESKCTAGYFTRDGGVSSDGFSSLNCSIKSEDSEENVAENIQTAANSLGANTIKVAYQVHSDRVITVDSAEMDTESQEADAVVTNIKGLPVGVVTADCTPILFIDENAGVVGAAHAGWKGAYAGILENTVRAMEKLGAEASGIVACIGPTIAQNSYEVDSNFHTQFISQNPENEKYFYLSVNKGHFMFDLPKYCEDRLKSLDLKMVENLRLDTYTNENLFFSYRRKTHRKDQYTGCQISAIMLK